MPDLNDPPELVGHQDVTPENVVFREGRAYDLARPVSRAREFVNLMLWWAPLGAEADLDPEFRGLDRQRMWSEGVGDKIRARQTWLEENADSLTTALLS